MSNFTIDLNINAPDLLAAITALAVAISSDGAPESTPAQKFVPTSKPEPESKPEPKPEPAAAAASAPVVSLETVRAKLAALSQAGKQAQVKSLISKFGAKKLTEIPVEKYPELLAEAEGL